MLKLIYARNNCWHEESCNLRIGIHMDIYLQNDLKIVLLSIIS